MKFKTEREELIWTGRLADCLDDLASTNNNDYVSGLCELVLEGIFIFERISIDPNQIEYEFKVNTNSYRVRKTLTDEYFHIELFWKGSRDSLWAYHSSVYIAMMEDEDYDN